MLPVPMLLVLVVAWLSQSVPKEPAPADTATQAISVQADTLEAAPREDTLRFLQRKEPAITP